MLGIENNFPLNYLSMNINRLQQSNERFHKIKWYSIFVESRFR
jgi:hypothetical protein